ncbi:hypothetical protein J3R74_001224 [Puniceicoccus vermicola]
MLGGTNSTLPCSCVFESVQSHRLVCKDMLAGEGGIPRTRDGVVPIPYNLLN